MWGLLWLWGLWEFNISDLFSSYLHIYLSSSFSLLAYLRANGETFLIRPVNFLYSFSLSSDYETFWSYSYYSLFEVASLESVSDTYSYSWLSSSSPISLFLSFILWGMIDGFASVGSIFLCDLERKLWGFFYDSSLFLLYWGLKEFIALFLPFFFLRS